MPDFSSLAEVYAYRESAFVLDLRRCSSVLRRGEFENAYTEPPHGAYIQTEMRPLIPFNAGYYQRGLLKVKKTDASVVEYDYAASPQIATLQDIVTSPSEIVDSHENIKLTVRDNRKLRHMLFDHPKIDVQAVHLAQLSLTDYINSTCRYARLPVSTRQEYRDLLKPEFWYLYEDGLVDRALEEIQAEISRFIGEHDQHIYTAVLNGTFFMLEKKIDYRIFWFYQQQFDTSQDE